MADKINLSCLNCSHTALAEPKYANKMIVCPRCGLTARFVPAQATQAAQAPAVAAPPTPAPVAAPTETGFQPAPGASSVSDGFSLAPQPTAAPPPAMDTSFKKPCRKCDAMIDRDAVICVQCGTNQSSGINVKTVQRMKDAGAGLSKFTGSLIACGVTAVLGGVIWCVIAVVAEVEIGYLAWGIGAATGWVMLVTSGNKASEFAGFSAAGFALGGIVLGKVLIVTFGMPIFVGQELEENPKLIDQYKVIMLLALVAEDGDAEATSLIERWAATESESRADKIMTEAKVFLSRHYDDHEAVLKSISDEKVKEFIVEVNMADGGFWAMFKETWGVLDVAFVLLAVSSAYAIPAGGRD